MILKNLNITKEYLRQIFNNIKRQMFNNTVNFFLVKDA